jgi:hypothetical protein
MRSTPNKQIVGAGYEQQERIGRPPVDPFDLSRSFGYGRAWTTLPENGYLSIVLR